MNDAWDQWIDQLMMAVTNGIAQGVLLTLFVWGLLRLSRSTNASTRYLVWMGAMGSLAALPIAHFLLATAGTGQGVRTLGSERSVPAPQPASFETIASQTPEASVETAGVRGFHANTLSDVSISSKSDRAMQASSQFPTRRPSRSERRTDTFRHDHVTMEGMHAFTDQSIETGGMAATKQTPVPTSPPAESVPEETTNPVAAAAPFKAALDAVQQRVLHPSRKLTIQEVWPAWLRNGVVLLIGFGVGWRFLRLAKDMWVLSRLKREAMPATDELERMFDDIRQTVPLRHGIQLKSHPSLKTPLAAGFFHPTILMPSGLEEALGEETTRQILRHELAHLQRYDDWTKLFQCVVQSLFFFHPAVWYAGRRADMEREIACDDHAVQGLRQAKSYALMLTQFANRERDRHLAAASAVWNKKSQIKERIDMLLDHHRNTAPKPARLSAGLLTIASLIVAAMALQFGPRVALAQKPASENSSSSIFATPVTEPRAKEKGAAKQEQITETIVSELSEPTSDAVVESRQTRSTRSRAARTPERAARVRSAVQLEPQDKIKDKVKSKAKNIMRSSSSGHSSEMVVEHPPVARSIAVQAERAAKEAMRKVHESLRDLKVQAKVSAPEEVHVDVFADATPEGNVEIRRRVRNRVGGPSRPAPAVSADLDGDVFYEVHVEGDVASKDFMERLEKLEKMVHSMLEGKAKKDAWVHVEENGDLFGHPHKPAQPTPAEERGFHKGNHNPWFAELHIPHVPDHPNPFLASQQQQRDGLTQHIKELSRGLEELEIQRRHLEQQRREVLEEMARLNEKIAKMKGTHDDPEKRSRSSAGRRPAY